MAKQIYHEFFFSHPPEMVWEYLTRAELMAQWLMPTDFEPIVGYDFQFKTKPIPSLDFDGIIYCKVLEIVPFKKLSYSWKTGPGNNKITVDSLVEWKLKQKDNGTELSVLHSGFSEVENLSMFSALNDGWLKNIHKIAELINAATHSNTNS